MLVTVVIPYFKRIDLLIETISSIVNSSLKPEELILINDCSPEGLSDKDINWCKAHFKSFVHLRNENINGPVYSRQKGLEIAQGAFVHFLDSDDLVKPDFYEKILAKLEASPEAAMCYAFTNRFDGLKEIPGFKRKQIEVSNILDAISTMKVRRVWSTSACVWRTAVAKQSEGWSPTFIWEDYYFDIAVGLINPRVVCVPEPLLLYRTQLNNQLSTGNDYKKYLKKHETIILLKKLTLKANHSNLSMVVQNGYKTNAKRLITLSGKWPFAKEKMEILKTDFKLGVVALLNRRIGERLISAFF